MRTDRENMRLIDERSDLIENGFALLPGFASAKRDDLLREIEQVAAVAPFTTLRFNGSPFRVEMTYAGRYAWHADNVHGRYEPRYTETHPMGMALPTVPDAMANACADVLAKIGWNVPYRIDTVLVNRYTNPAGTTAHAKLGKHKDKDERVNAPVVSISLGATCDFVFEDRTIRLEDGDVCAFWGPKRFALHAVGRVHGPLRYNLTFRQVDP